MSPAKKCQSVVIDANIDRNIDTSSDQSRCYSMETRNEQHINPFMVTMVIFYIRLFGAKFNDLDSLRREDDSHVFRT